MGKDQFSIRTIFFKIMLPGFDERLKLPPAFCVKVKHEKSKRAILECCKGRWVISVCREDDDQIFLDDGWPQFADEHGLSLRDYLVFKHTGNLHFNVMVYDITGCLKKFLIEPDDEHQTINPSYHPKKKSPLHSRSLSFNVEMTHYTAIDKRKGKVTIPLQFVKRNNLGQKKDAILNDPQRGRKWRVKLGFQNSPQFRVYLTTGWQNFAAANNLEVGDLCNFQLKPTKSPTSENIYFDVRILRNTNC